MSLTAEKILTKISWEDLVLPALTYEKVAQVKQWLSKKPAPDSSLQSKGMSIIFHGPQGTGKRLTAAVLGKDSGRQVYLINLALVVSKYIGETEKNLEKIFASAEAGQWILFFDEADALFGKRTEVKDSHDRYANLEVSYLLNRLQNFRGLSIVTLRTTDNIDEGLIKSFHMVVGFPIPALPERTK